MKHNNGKAPRLGRQRDGSYRCEDGGRVSTLRKQFEHDRLSGRNHSLQDSTLRAYRSRLGQMMDYMQKSMGIHSHHHIKSTHIERYISHLTRVSSQKGAEGQGYRGHKGGLNDRSLANHVSAIRWFATRNGIDMPDRNAAYGLSRDRKNDEERPIQFSRGWQEVHAAYQEKLEKVASWVGAVSQLGAAFGLRTKERLLSNTVLAVGERSTPEGPKRTYHLEVAGRPAVEVTREELISKSMYKASFDKRLDRLEVGKEYLVVRLAKGGRVRAQAIYNEERRSAVERIQEMCRANETSAVRDGQPPTAIPYGAFKGSINAAGEVSKSFVKQAHTFLRNTYHRAGGTIANLLHCNADRHFDTQRMAALLKDGSDARLNDDAWREFRKEHPEEFMFSREDLIEERGHSDDRKLAHYVDLL